MNIFTEPTDTQIAKAYSVLVWSLRVVLFVIALAFFGGFAACSTGIVMVSNAVDRLEESQLVSNPGEVVAFSGSNGLPRALVWVASKDGRNVDVRVPKDGLKIVNQPEVGDQIWVLQGDGFTIVSNSEASIMTHESTNLEIVEFVDTYEFWVNPWGFLLLVVGFAAALTSGILIIAIGAAVVITVWVTGVTWEEIRRLGRVLYTGEILVSGSEILDAVT